MSQLLAHRPGCLTPKIATNMDMQADLRIQLATTILVPGNRLKEAELAHLKKVIIIPMAVLKTLR